MLPGAMGSTREAPLNAWIKGQFQGGLSESGREDWVYCVPARPRIAEHLGVHRRKASIGIHDLSPFRLTVDLSEEVLYGNRACIQPGIESQPGSVQEIKFRERSGPPAIISNGELIDGPDQL